MGENRGILKENLGEIGIMKGGESGINGVGRKEEKPKLPPFIGEGRGC